jgi:probable HAF family extracellular repeat protein
MIDLGTLGGTNGSPNALNNRGHVVGQSNVSGDLSSHPFFWDGHRMIDIGTAGGNFGNAWALNEADEVVGSTTTSGDAAWRAFVWKHGVRTDLPTLPGACGSLAWGIDSRRRVVGNAIGCGFNAIPAGEVVMWDHGTIVDLNDLVPSDAPLHLTQVGPISQAGPFVINDRGEIAGIGTPTGVPTEQSIFKGHAFLLIPCEEDEARCDGSVRKQ